MSANPNQVVQYRSMDNKEAKKQFWSLTAVVFLAVVMPTLLRQLNKVTRTMAGAEGRLAAINIETDRILGKRSTPFTENKANIEEKVVSPDQIKYLVMKYGAGKTIQLDHQDNAYLAAMGAELTNYATFGNSKSTNEVTKLFDLLGPQKLFISGNGTWVYATSTKIKNTYQVILVNYDPEGKHSEVVPVNFINLEAGNFEFRKTYLGSPTTYEKFSTDSGKVQKMIPMIANSIAFLELETK